jgi:hypothetical protein
MKGLSVYPSKLLIAVPSFNRPYQIDKTIMRWLPSLDYDWKVFVEPDQLKYYAQSVPMNHLVVTHDGNGLMGQIVDIKHWAETAGYDAVWKVDDDMMFVQRGKGVKKCVETVREIVPLMLQKLQEIDVGVVSVAKPREYMYSKGVDFKTILKPIYGNYMATTHLLPEKKEYSLFDDLLVSVNAMLNDQMIVKCFLAYEQSKTHSNKGGLQSFNRSELSKAGYYAIKNDYPKVEGIMAHQTKNDCFDLDVSRYFK